MANTLMSTRQNSIDMLEERALPSTSSYHSSTTSVSIHNAACISTGLELLDAKLCHGLHIGSITDVSGPPGIGKTQLCLSCVLSTFFTFSDTAKKPSILYFDTELKFDSRRLLEMAQHRYPEHFWSDTQIVERKERERERERDDDLEKGVCTGTEELLAHVHVRRPTSTSSLTAELENLQVFLMMNNIRLIVIDSMATLTRKEMLSEKECSLVVSKQAAILLKLAAVCRCAILTTNQVVTVSRARPVQEMDSIAPVAKVNAELEETDSFWDESSRTHYRPCLGLTWFHCVTVRILMTTFSKREQKGTSATTETNANNGGFTQRVMLLSKSPCAMPCCVPFAVGMRGIIT
eukprot:CAMPEP_0182437084 /NCGR_PEP_ID=MMETSP1167-20130531/84803_1 /TAXON_ID=2988 /ORGANISM="Mallomonas Sp, Strain CCMP3275" /LENGTH=348 /DNA_ID=CAMNT_0024629875 /DNA_START=519 /DNA_END=1566 /DNA_ORIENTATION=+